MRSGCALPLPITAWALPRNTCRASLPMASRRVPRDMASACTAAHSRPGSWADLWWPTARALAAAQDSFSTCRARRTVHSQSAATAPRILVIDDNRAIHADLRKVLNQDAQSQAEDQFLAAEAILLGETVPRTEHIGFEIDSAYQGRDGVDMARAACAEGRP